MAFDLIILGDTPDAWTAAHEAASLGCRCAVLRPDFDYGVAAGVTAVIAAFGTGAETGARTTLRCGTPAELWRNAVIRHERHIATLLREAGVQAWQGPARLTGVNSAEVFVSGVGRAVEAEFMLIATGTIARKPRGITLDRSRFLVPESVGTLSATPSRLVVLGDSPTATAFAKLFVAAGSDVTLIAEEASESKLTVASSIRSRVIEVQKSAAGVVVRCTNDEQIAADAVLFADRRHGATAAVGLAAAGLEADDEGRLWCDEQGMTWQPTIAAAGEVIGFPRELAFDPEGARRVVATRFGQRAAVRIDAGTAGNASKTHRPAVPKPADRRMPELRIFRGAEVL